MDKRQYKIIHMPRNCNFSLRAWVVSAKWVFFNRSKPIITTKTVNYFCTCDHNDWVPGTMADNTYLDDVSGPDGCTFAPGPS
jgi:hypothetical protein